MVRCPDCSVEIHPNWDWCHACGFDPEGRRPASFVPSSPAVVPASLGLGSSPLSRRGPGATGGRTTTAPAPPPAPLVAPQYAPPPYNPNLLKKPSPRPRILRRIASVAFTFIVISGLCIAAVTFMGPAPRRTPAAAGPTTPTLPVVRTWSTWSPTEGGFTVEFPGAPTAGPMPGADDDERIARHAVLDLGPAVYLIGYMDPAPGKYLTGGPAELMDGMVTAAIKGMPGLVETGRTPDTWAGMPSLQFRAGGTYKAVAMEGRGRVIVAGTRTYVFLTVDAPAAGEPADFDRFLGSFQIT